MGELLNRRNKNKTKKWKPNIRWKPPVSRITTTTEEAPAQVAPFKPIISVLKGSSSSSAEDEMPKAKKSSKPVFIRKSPRKQATAAVVSESPVETVVPLSNGVVMHVVEINQDEKRDELPTTTEKTRMAPVFRPYPAINRSPFEHSRRPTTV